MAVATAVVSRRAAALGLRGSCGRVRRRGRGLLGLSRRSFLVMLGRVPARMAVPMRRGACDGRCGSVTTLVAECLRLALWRADRLRRGDRRCRGRRGNRDRRRRSRDGAGGADNPGTRARTRVMRWMHTVDRGARSPYGCGRGEDRRCGGDRRRSRRPSVPGCRSRRGHSDALNRAAERGQQRYRLALQPGARQEEQRKGNADRRPKGEDGWREVGERRLHVPEVVRVLAVRSAGERRYTKDSAESAAESTPSGSFLPNPVGRNDERVALSPRARESASLVRRRDNRLRGARRSRGTGTPLDCRHARE
jgi:hypothetical protein